MPVGSTLTRRNRCDPKSCGRPMPRGSRWRIYPGKKPPWPRPEQRLRNRRRPSKRLPHLRLAVTARSPRRRIDRPALTQSSLRVSPLPFQKHPIGPTRSPLLNSQPRHLDNLERCQSRSLPPRGVRPGSARVDHRKTPGLTTMRPEPAPSCDVHRGEWRRPPRLARSRRPLKVTQAQALVITSLEIISKTNHTTSRSLIFR